MRVLPLIALPGFKDEMRQVIMNTREETRTQYLDLLSCSVCFVGDEGFTLLESINCLDYLLELEVGIVGARMAYPRTCFMTRKALGNKGIVSKDTHSFLLMEHAFVNLGSE